MRDLWTELATKVRRSDPDMHLEMPFGFDDAVLSGVATRAVELPGPHEVLTSLIRPALGLAFGAAMFCILLQRHSEPRVPANLFTETAALFESALLND